MRWDELTGDEFAEVVRKVKGVCLLPLSCIERHGHHLPLGTDMFIGRQVCERAAGIEPAIVFPDFIFTQNLVARHVPGAIGIEPELILRLLENTCREIAHNGMDKIVLVNAHGGNEHLIRYFAQTQLASPRNYVLYVAPPTYAAEEAATAAQWDTTVDGHAGERETSTMLAMMPELVRCDALPSDGEGMPRKRLGELRDLNTFTGIWWYADHPTHYCGDGIPATAEKGKLWLEDRAHALARVIRAIKEDNVTKQLQAEFFKKSDTILIRH